MTSPIAGNVWEATDAAMTTINFRSRFIVLAVADDAEFKPPAGDFGLGQAGQICPESRAKVGPQCVERNILWPLHQFEPGFLHPDQPTVACVGFCNPRARSGWNR